jgi:hypothetical protein
MDFEDITLGEIEEIESYAGMTISEIADDKPGVIKLRIGLVWIIKRRENPSFTIEDAKKLTPKQLDAFLSEDDSKKE